MKRSLIIPAAILVLSSLVMTGCGKSASTGVVLPSKMSSSKKTTTPSNTAVGQTPAGTGSLVLSLSSLKKAAYAVAATSADVATLEVKMTGAGLTAPLIKRMTATELKNSNTVQFDGVPVGPYIITLTAFDAKGANIGQKGTDVQVTANQETAVKLQLKLNPSTATGSIKFDFDIVDGDVVEAPEDETEATGTDEPETAPDADDDGLLGIEIVGKQVNRKFLLFKKLEVTVKVTNHNKSEAISGEVKIEYYKMSGLFTKEPKLVETLTQTVNNLQPGKSVEITLQSSKAADDAEATIHTVVSSASASTVDE